MVCLASAFVLALWVPQEPDAPLPVPQAIRRAAYLESEAPAVAQHLCDRIGPRPTGSASHRRAAEWMRERFAALGLDARLEEFEVPTTWRRGSARARIVAPIERELAVLASGWSPASDGSLRLSLSLEKRDGTAVLVDPSFTPLRASDAHPFAGAGAVLVDAQRPYSLVPTGMATWGAPFVAAPMPTMFVATEDAALLRRLAAAGDVQLELIVGAKLGDAAPSVDVIADLRGDADAEKVLLAVAQLDTWDVGPGALDSAADCAVLLETARLLSALPDAPRRTIRFVLLSGVEQGLGTSGYVARRSDEELARHVGGFALEGGGGPLHGVMLAGREDFLVRAEGWFAPVRDLGVRDIGFRTSLRRLPEALQARGVPVFAVVQQSPELPAVDDSRADTPDRILTPDLMQASCVLAHGLWAWANEE